MDQIICPICLESLQHPDENRGGIRVTACGHVFHTDCITRSVHLNHDCPTCRLFILLRSMNPLFLPNDNEQPPIHDRIYQHLILRRDDREVLDFHHVRLVIYPNEPNNNQLEVVVDVRQLETDRVQPNQPPHRIPHAQRHSFEPQRLNYNRVSCVFCQRIITTNDGAVACNSCLRQMNRQ